jgi:hypothetical protein
MEKIKDEEMSQEGIRANMEEIVELARQVAESGEQ